MKVRSFAITDIGKKRKVNQDSYFVDDQLGLYVVADGMGGHRGGEVASQLAVEVLSKYCREHKDLSARDRLERGINQSCRKIHQRSQEVEELAGMGTTVLALLFDGDTGYLGHVGDSRAYLINQGGVWQITEDHSLLNEEIRAGRLDIEEAGSYQFKNVITRSVGYESQVAVEIYQRKVRKDDMLLLCTDGLSGLVQMPEIAEGLKSETTDFGLKKLIDLANQRGGDDNITAVACSIENLGTS